MKKTNLYNSKGEVLKEIDLNPSIFDLEINEGLIQQVVDIQFANDRVVLAHTKTKGEVRGGGKKPWKQKGTGRARAGSSRSPLWVGGGVTFGPRKNRNFSKKINKSMKKKALLMTLTDKANNNWLVVLDELKFDKPRTKDLLNILKKLPTFETKNKKVKIKSADKPTEVKTKTVKEIAKTLIVAPDDKKNLFLSNRNLKNTEVILANSLNVADLLKYKYVVMPVQCLDIIEKTYLK
jgi:large subunit ribosomal protein L4